MQTDKNDMKVAQRIILLEINGGLLFKLLVNAN